MYIPVLAAVYLAHLYRGTGLHAFRLIDHLRHASIYTPLFRVVVYAIVLVYNTGQFYSITSDISCIHD